MPGRLATSDSYGSLRLPPKELAQIAAREALLPSLSGPNRK